ncbi:ranBP-type and C3HC4-type zinc finger-containing protein 1-like isoform X2 [Lineus longissimus]|uniref:ranBP-type and C3HC4-type zinc finger-containing protein 1-like isoform X2 n=1 Tax=Lineus longissimus TaxID=88925 RepID=UPI00315DC53C
MAGLPSRTMSQSAMNLSTPGPMQSSAMQATFSDTQSLHQGWGFGQRTYPFPEGSAVPPGQPFFGRGPPISPVQGPPTPSPLRQISSTSTSSQASSLTVSDLKNLVESLQISLAHGEVEQAKHLTSLLAQYKTKIEMVLSESEAEKSDLRLRVYVEYKEKSAGCIILKAGMKDTIADLKRSMLFQYRLPTKLQRWIIGKRLPADTDTLESLGVTSSSSESPVFLYMMSAKFAGIDREQVDREFRRASDYEVVGRPGEETVQAVPSPGPPGSAAQPQRTGLHARAATISGHGHSKAMNSPTAEWKRGSTGQIDENVASMALVQPEPEQTQLKWECPGCTFRNFPTWPGCEMCNTERPTSFKIPTGYVPTPRERQRTAQENVSESQFLESQQQQRERERAEQTRNYLELVEMDDRDLIRNTTMIECPVCFDMIPAGDGVVLRECLHESCRACLADYVLNFDGAQVPCPHEGCDENLQDREVKALVTPEVFMKYLHRSVSIAENRTPNSFHCKTPDCRGWVIYDDDVNFFECNVCGHRNCLTCKAIHEDLNCQEYQLELQMRAQNDENARKTQDMLMSLLAKGEAMKCPSCLIVLQKKDGCDWMRCTMCQTEICWATRGPRWGPRGSGDTSGGCGCRANGKKCHPTCQNCH